MAVDPALDRLLVRLSAAVEEGYLLPWVKEGPRQGGFKRSSQRQMSERRLRWVGGCGRGSRPVGRSCGRLVGRRSGGLIIGGGSGRRSLRAPRARRLRRPRGCPVRLVSGGF